MIMERSRGETPCSIEDIEEQGRLTAAHTKLMWHAQ